MIKSMTAFARSDMETPSLRTVIEMRSVNNRYLDLVIRMHPGSPALEKKIKGVVSQSLYRGRVEISVNIEDLREESPRFEINHSKASAYVSALEALKQQFSLAQATPLELLAKMPGIISSADIQGEMEDWWPTIEACLEKTLAELDQMRQNEGASLAADIEGRLADIHSRLKEIDQGRDDLLQKYTQRLENRIATLTQGLVEIESDRIAQEAALLADRSDISEEIVRAESHLRQFREIMAAQEPGGRKLNFLLQELGREFNTMGAKAGNSSISHQIVAVKAELEKIREQVQNIE